MALQNRSKILAFLISASGIVVLLGWAFQINLIKSGFPGLPPMRVLTAILFILSGIGLYLLAEFSERKKLSDSNMILLFLSSVLVFMLTIIRFFVTITGIQSGLEEGLENLFANGLSGSVAQVPGRFSFGSTSAFFLFSMVALLASLDSYCTTGKTCRYTGAAIFIIGGVAVLGHILNLPILYYSIPGLSNSTALNASILIMLLGYGLFSLTREKDI